MWTEIRLWLVGIAGLAVLTLAWAGLTGLVYRLSHDASTAGGWGFLILAFLVSARLLAGLWLRMRKDQREFEEANRDFNEQQDRVRAKLRGR